VASWVLRWTGVFDIGAWIEDGAKREDPIFAVAAAAYVIVLGGVLVSGGLYMVAERRAGRRPT
jgi:hypothetical protein